jgi:hypothetical protein
MHPWNTWFAEDGCEIPFPLLPGDWIVRVGLPGFVTAEVPLRAEEGLVHALDVVLERSTTARVR